MASLVTQADLEARVGANELVSMADDDRDGVADDSVIAWAIDIGSRRVEGILLGSFDSTARIAELVNADPSLRNDVAEVVLGVLSTRRPSFLDANGKTPLSALAELAEKRIQKVADSDLNSAGEEVAGQNDVVRTRTNRANSAFVFATSKASPRGPGGF